MKQNVGLTENPRKYNFILVIVDGGRLDRLRLKKNFTDLSKKATFFTKMITYGAQTVMSMHATFTGLYGNINGANNYFGSALFKKDKCKTLASYLKDSSFYTRGDTINKIVVPSQGFDNLSIHDEVNDDLAETHKNILREMKSVKDQGKNFFAYLHYSNIHTGMIDSVLKKYGDFDDAYFNNQEENTKNYDVFINEADNYLKGVYSEFESLGLGEDTVFIIVSDHGASLGDKKGEIGYGRYCYDYTMKSFAIFIQPKIFPIQEVKDLCRTVDLLPTVLQINNIPLDQGFMQPQGESLFNLMTGESKERFAFSESAGMVDPYPTKEKPILKAVRSNDWKLIYNIKTKEKELYNLVDDPLENNNLSSENTPKTQEMFQKLAMFSPEVMI